MASIIGAGIASSTIPFGGAAVAAGAVLAGLLVGTVTILVVADLWCAA
jgi:hypothetical protein